MTQNRENLEHDESGLGSYVSDVAYGIVDSTHATDDMHDANPAFHHDETLHDQASGVDEATGETRTTDVNEWTAAGEEIGVVPDNQILVSDAKLVEAGLRRAEHRLARRRARGGHVDPDQLTDADEWMAANNQRW